MYEVWFKSDEFSTDHKLFCTMINRTDAERCSTNLQEEFGVVAWVEAL